MAGKTYKLDKYRAEAQLDPFTIEVAEGHMISIQPPSAETMMAIGETPVQDGRKMLRLLCGEQYEELWAAVAWEPAAVVTSLVKDLVEHFGLGQAALRDTPGGSVALPR
jgi:hypothetical protein